MTTHKLFVGALAVTIAMGAFFFVAASPADAAAVNVTRCTNGKIKKKPRADVTYYRNNKAACDAALANPSASPSISISPTPSTTINPSPTASVSPTATPIATPSPIITVVPVGETVTVVQQQWVAQQSGVTPTMINNLTTTTAKLCGAEQDLGDKAVIWTKYLDLKKINRQKDTTKLVGVRNQLMSQSNMISNVFALTEGNTAKWSRLHITFNLAQSGTLELYYRVSDSGGTASAADKDWIKVADPASITTEQCGTTAAPSRLASFTINQTGKYFQYMIRMTSPKTGKPQLIRRVSLHGQALERTETYPSPTPTPSGSPTASTTHGKITIVTKKLVIEPTVKKVDTKTGSAPLPDITPRNTPSPTPTSSASTKPKVDPFCFADHETDYAPEVPIRIRQTEGGDALVEDETTNDLGLWKGLEGKVDEFKTGAYRINFGEFQKDDYKLVAICVSPDSYLHYVKTQTTASGSQAIVMVLPNKETKITVLYAPRDKPYVSLDTFAVTEANKVKRVAYPGQSFRYIIRYENTGDVAAHNVVIRDVIPEQYYVPNEETLGEQGPFTSEIDNQGRTVIVKSVGVLAKGQKGSLTIPVILRSNAFGSPDDIAARFGVDTSSGGANQPKTLISPTSAATDSGDGALNLE